MSESKKTMDDELEYFLRRRYPNRTMDVPIKLNPPGRCRYCGCKVYRTETICGECACEEEGCE